MRAGTLSQSVSQSVSEVNNCLLFLIQLGQKLNNNLLIVGKYFQFSIKYFLIIIKTQLKYLFLGPPDQVVVVVFVRDREVTLSDLNVRTENTEKEIVCPPP